MKYNMSRSKKVLHVAQTLYDERGLISFYVLPFLEEEHPFVYLLDREKQLLGKYYLQAHTATLYEHDTLLGQVSKLERGYGFFEPGAVAPSYLMDMQGEHLEIQQAQRTIAYLDLSHDKHISLALLVPEDVVHYLLLLLSVSDLLLQ
ncbi:MAG: hypothetical protein ACRDBX_05500 [Erysipelotrichaceae bacterium]